MTMSKTETLYGGEDLPPLGKAEIILVVPFHNEEQILPQFIDSLKANQTSAEKIYILGINHRSEDKSEEVLRIATHGYVSTGIVHEDQDIASVGIPRQRGLKTAFDLVRKNSQRKTIVGSIDADSVVSPRFFEEAERFLDTTHDFLLFPTRNDQRQFLECIGMQKDEVSIDAALYTLVGVDWLKYQLRGFLLNAGAIETRGSGGYFFTAEGYAKAHGHKAVYSADGTIVTGESNAIGIRAKRNRATAIVSSYLNTASPRRIFKSLRTSTDGYVLASGGKTFESIANNQELPILGCAQWEQRFQKMIYGAIRTFVIKAIAYEVVPELQANIQIPELYELLEAAKTIYEATMFVADEKDAIGSRAYISVFGQAYESLGGIKQNTLTQKLLLQLPDKTNLIRWANDGSLVIGPQRNLR